MTLIDKSDAFVFGFSKLDVMFGHADAGRGAPAVPRLREAGRASAARNGHGHRPGDAARDHRRRHARCRLPGGRARRRLRRRGHAGAGRRERVLLGRRRDPPARRPAHASRKGHAVIGVCGAPYKCPPAPSECALMLHDYLLERGVREPMRHHDGAAPAEPGAAVSRYLQGADRRVRRARHRVHAQPPRGVGGRCAPRRHARRRQRAALRPVPRRAEAPRARRWSRPPAWPKTAG